MHHLQIKHSHPTYATYQLDFVLSQGFVYPHHFVSDTILTNILYSLLPGWLLNLAFCITNTSIKFASVNPTPHDKAIQLLYKCHKQHKVKNLYSTLYMEMYGWVKL